MEESDKVFWNVRINHIVQLLKELKEGKQKTFIQKVKEDLDYFIPPNFDDGMLKISQIKEILDKRASNYGVKKDGKVHKMA